MSWDQRDNDRAARARNGSRRKRDLAAAGFRNAGALTYPKTQARLKWVDETFPDLENPSWRPFLAVAASMVNRAGQSVNRQNVLARVWANYGEDFCRENGLPR